MLLQLKDEKLGPVIWTEGELPVEHFNLELIDMLNQLEPFGREFEQPVFEIIAHLKEIRMIGDGTHARVVLESDGVKMSGVWFKMRQTVHSSISVNVGEKVKVAFSLKANTFRQRRTLDMHIAHMEIC